VFDYLEKSGIPILVNVHIGMKAGIIANWLKKKKKIPYVVSDQWTGLLTEADDKISNRPFYFRFLWKKIISGASAISAVSIYLADAIKSRFDLQKVTVIPNVVNTSIFYPALTSTNYLKFIHISTLENFKNPKTIINAMALVIEIYPSVILDIFGPYNKQLEDLASKLGVEKNIHFHNEIPQLKLAEHIRQSLALILYSAYETFGCVIAEANACGIPVIVSDIPVLHETVSEGMNGIFAKPNDSAALAEKMIEMIKTRTSFDSNAIVSENSKYSYEKVGRQFSDWYDEILSKKI
jgi:glycosyltransferase involved in cell wall biosynthesis